jgi:hypothetical protein
MNRPMRAKRDASRSCWSREDREQRQGTSAGGASSAQESESEVNLAGTALRHSSGGPALTRTLESVSVFSPPIFRSQRRIAFKVPLLNIEGAGTTICLGVGSCVCRMKWRPTRCRFKDPWRFIVKLPAVFLFAAARAGCRTRRGRIDAGRIKPQESAGPVAGLRFAVRAECGAG